MGVKIIRVIESTNAKGDRKTASVPLATELTQRRGVD